MTTEHALRSFESGFSHPDFALTTEGAEAYEIACQAMREKIERENPKPLTLDELRNMNGKPVWIEKKYSDLESYFGIVCLSFNQEYVMSFIAVTQGYAMLKVHFSEYGATWLAYKYKPKETY